MLRGMPASTRETGEIKIKLTRTGALVNCVVAGQRVAVGTGRRGPRTSDQQ